MISEKVIFLLSANFGHSDGAEYFRLQETLKSLCQVRGPFNNVEIHLYINNLIDLPDNPPTILHIRPYEPDPFKDYRRFTLEMTLKPSDWIVFVEQDSYLMPYCLTSLGNFTLTGPINGRLAKSYTTGKMSPFYFLKIQYESAMELPNKENLPSEATIAGSALRFHYLRRFFGSDYTNNAQLQEFIEMKVLNSTVEERPIAIKILPDSSKMESIRQQINRLKTNLDEMDISRIDNQDTLNQIKDQLKEIKNQLSTVIRLLDEPRDILQVE